MLTNKPHGGEILSTEMQKSRKAAGEDRSPQGGDARARACVLSRFSHVQLSVTLWTVLCPRDSPGKHAGVGRHALLQGIFPTQGSNQGLLCLLHWRVGFFFTTSTTRKVIGGEE